MIHLGSYNTATTRTHVGFQFSTHAAAGGNVAPLSAIDAADIRIYRAADGAAFSATQRSSANGITCTSPFDSLTGFHDIDIDLTDNTDAGFYAAGYRYSVVLAPDTETIDGQTITGVVLAYFEIGPPPVNVTQWGGSATPVTNINTIFNTDYATVYDATNKAFLSKLGNFAMGGSSLALTTGAIACTTITASGAVAFQSTFAVTTSTSLGALSCTTLTASGAVAFQSTFAVTTSTALAALSCTTLTASGAVALQSTFAITGTTTLTGAVTASNASNNIVGIDVAKVAGATQTAGDLAALINTVDDFLDTEIAAIKAKTDNLPSDPADASDIAGAFSTVNTTLATIAGYIDTEVGAIKTKTDQLVFTVANTLNVNVQYVNDVQVNGDGQPGTEWGP